jgi:uncharacterized membrane protein YhaH (DUF805 family)
MTDQNSFAPATDWQHRARHALFAFQGRVGRLAFIAGFAIVVVVVLSLVYVSIALAGNDQGAAGGAISAVAFLLALAALWPLTALMTKRLHDLNRSGWHGVWLVALWLSPNLMPDALETPATLAAIATLLALAALPGRASTQIDRNIAA